MLGNLILDIKIAIASHYEHTWWRLYSYDPEFAQYAVTTAGKARFVVLFTDRSNSRTSLFGKLHSINDEPSRVTLFCSSWHNNGILHRINGPAIQNADGSMEYHVAGKLHRDDDLPAFVGKSSYRAWYNNGKRHRENGPAVIYQDDMGTEYWINGVKISDPI